MLLTFRSGHIGRDHTSRKSRPGCQWRCLGALRSEGEDGARAHNREGEDGARAIELRHDYCQQVYGSLQARST